MTLQRYSRDPLWRRSPILYSLAIPATRNVSSRNQILRSSKAFTDTSNNFRKNHSQILRYRRRGKTGIFYATDCISRRNSVNFVLNKKIGFFGILVSFFLRHFCIKIRRCFTTDIGHHGNESREQTDCDDNILN